MTDGTSTSNKIVWSALVSPGGTALVEESLAEALEFRRAMIRIADEMPGPWWFSV